MTEQQKLNEIIALMSFLKSFIQNHINQSFTDLSFDLETFIKDYLNVFENDGEKYENINHIRHNYPAIDLVNKKMDIALQVTTNADLRKVKKTIDTYQKHNLSYSSLIVIGFVNATSSIIPNVNVYKTDHLIEIAKHGTSMQKDEIFDILKKRIPWNSLTPMDDKQCFDVVFDVINRSAVRDYTLCEGDFNKMVDGLSEIKEIITTGKIKGKPIRAKALVEYTAKTKTMLSDIEFRVSQILQICNSNKNIRNSDFLCLSKTETDDIDKLKEEIINKSNDLALVLQLNRKIIGSRRC